MRNLYAEITLAYKHDTAVKNQYWTFKRHGTTYAKMVRMAVSGFKPYAAWMLGLTSPRTVLACWMTRTV